MRGGSDVIIALRLHGPLVYGGLRPVRSSAKLLPIWKGVQGISKVEG